MTCCLCYFTISGDSLRVAGDFLLLVTCCLCYFTISGDSLLLVTPCCWWLLATCERPFVQTWRSYQRDIATPMQSTVTVASKRCYNARSVNFDGHIKATLQRAFGQPWRRHQNDPMLADTAEATIRDSYVTIDLFHYSNSGLKFLLFKCRHIQRKQKTNKNF